MISQRLLCSVSYLYAVRLNGFNRDNFRLLAGTKSDYVFNSKSGSSCLAEYILVDDWNRALIGGGVLCIKYEMMEFLSINIPSKWVVGRWSRNV